MIVVEDGTGKADANSYVSVAELREYATDRSIELPVAEEEVEALLHKAMDYFFTVATSYRGMPTFTTQGLPFPRSIMNGYRWVDEGVPDSIKQAQMVAAIAAKDGDLTGHTSIKSSALATERTVGPLTVKYAEGASSHRPVSAIPLFMALLRPWLYSGQPAVVRG